MRCYSENKRFTYLPIGWSIFTRLTEVSRFPLSAGL